LGTIEISSNEPRWIKLVLEEGDAIRKNEDFEGKGACWIRKQTKFSSGFFKWAK